MAAHTRTAPISASQAATVAWSFGPGRQPEELILACPEFSSRPGPEPTEDMVQQLSEGSGSSDSPPLPGATDRRRREHGRHQKEGSTGGRERRVQTGLGAAARLDTMLGRLRRAGAVDHATARRIRGLLRDAVDAQLLSEGRDSKGGHVVLVVVVDVNPVLHNVHRGEMLEQTVRN